MVVPTPAAANPVDSPLLIVKDLSAEGVRGSTTATQVDIINSLDTWAKDDLLKMLKDPSKNWQPQDFLPDPSSDTFIDEVIELRERTRNIPDDTLICLAGDLITEEALPTYMSMINGLDAVGDETGIDETGWAIWNRMWTAEENRHGDLLNKYLWLTGRIDLKMIEVTVQNLIGSGMDPKTENNPFLGFIYTSFQERATKISHGNTGNHARQAGDPILAKICGTIAADEGRHEIAYQKVVTNFFEADASLAMLCWADMVKKQIAMPAHLMTDGVHMQREGRSLFADFSSVAENTGTYTAMDYADITEYLNKKWDIENQDNLTGEAAEAQEYLMKMPSRIRKLAERSYTRRKKKSTSAKFSWIYDREVEFW